MLALLVLPLPCSRGNGKRRSLSFQLRMRQEQEMGIKKRRRNQQNVQSRSMVVGGYQLQQDGYMNWRQRVVVHVKLAAGKERG